MAPEGRNWNWNEWRQHEIEEQYNARQHETKNNVENSNEKNNDNPQGIIVLSVSIHCETCGNEVLKCLRGFEGVEVIEIDAKNNQVTVKGKRADPIKVAERLRKKTGKHVELISPQPKEEEKKEEKMLEPKVIEVVLKINIHCEGCAKEVKHCILKMEGVQTVDPDMGKNQVTVKGTMDPQKLVKFINKKTGRQAEIVNIEIYNNEHYWGNNNECSYNYSPPEFQCAHLLFSDENPNSCSIL